MTSLTVEGELTIHPSSGSTTRLHAVWIRIAPSGTLFAEAGGGYGQLEVWLAGSRLACQANFVPNLVCPGNVEAKTLDVEGRLVLLGDTSRQPWAKLWYTAESGDTSIRVFGDVKWRTGDELLLASTDFEPDHAEYATVASSTLTECTGGDGGCSSTSCCPGRQQMYRTWFEVAFTSNPRCQEVGSSS